jgi:hypothetical protein
MQDFKEIQAKDIHIAVLNKQFRTYNHQSDRLIWWEEKEVVQVTKHKDNEGYHLWYCLKLDEKIVGIRLCDLIDRLVVARSHLDFVDVKWNKVG